MNIFWIFLILISLEPVFRKRLRTAARQNLISNIEKQRNSRVITIVHRQESMSLLGIPIIKYLSLEDSEEVLRALELTDDEKDIDLILHTPGGLVIAALQIARAIQKRNGKVRVIVPHYAMSGGTLIALAAHEIIMSENAVLGPVDPQIGEFPAPSLLKIVNQKKPGDIDDKTLVYADLAEKAINQLESSIRDLLKENYSAAKSEQLAKELTSGKWTHDFPITAEFGTQLGLHISTKIPKEALDLISLYRQPLRTQKTVEYTPGEK